MIGATDADVTFGWFSSKADFSDKGPNNSAPVPNFLGVTIGGPTRIGHYFLPKATSAKGNALIAQATKTNPKAGPIMT